MFFEDLELPDLVKKTLKETTATDLMRAGYTVAGAPANLNVRRTMRNSMARRISLRRPKQADVEALEREIDELEAAGDADGAARASSWSSRRYCKRTKLIPYIDPDRRSLQPLRARAAAEHPGGDVLPDGRLRLDDRDDEGSRQALLHAAARLPRAALPAPSTSCSSATPARPRRSTRRRSSTAARPAAPWSRRRSRRCWRSSRERYPLDTWNIYAAQASDGDNYGADSGRCVELLGGEVLPLCQYFAYIEVGEGGDGVDDARERPLALAIARSRRRTAISR